MAVEADELIALGERLELWSWRSPWLLQWRRGVRGAEFGTVCVLLRALSKEVDRCRGTPSSAQEISPSTVRRLGELWQVFSEWSRTLLEAEAHESNGRKSLRASDFSVTVQSLRMEIFNCVHCYGSKSYGGLYRQLVNGIDRLLFLVLKDG